MIEKVLFTTQQQTLLKLGKQNYINENSNSSESDRYPSKKDLQLLVDYKISD